MTAPAAPRTRLWLAIALALTAGKLWLTRGQGVSALGGAGHDDRLFLELAQHLVRGEWLGPGRELALTPHPFYPLFIAGAFILGLPLFFAQHLFYAVACALFVQALRPAITSAVARLALYALLLWNPMSFDGSAMSRVIAEQVHGPLGLMILAALVALPLRRAEPARRLGPWVGLLGLAGGAFYLTREEVAWLAPAVLLLAGAYLKGSWKISRAAGQAAARSLGAALVLALLPVLLVCAKNHHHYGWFAVGGPPPAAAPAEPRAGFATRLGQAVDFVASFSRFSARSPASEGSPEQLQLFRNVTHERLAPPVGEMDTVGGARYRLNLWKTEMLQQVGKALRPVLLGLFILAQVVVLLRVAQAAWRREWTSLLIVAVAAWSTGAAAVLLHALMPVPSGTGSTIASFAPVYPLMLAFIGVALADAATAWIRPRPATARPSGGSV